MAKDERMTELLMIGGSAGSLDVVFKLLIACPDPLPCAVVIVVHRKSNQDELLTKLLSTKTTLPVREVAEKEAILPGHVYVSPADYHLLTENDRTFSLDYSEKVQFSRPSIDVAFRSAAEVYGSSLACILLSGANSDGTQGLIDVQAAGGQAIIQDPASANVAYMPMQALRAMKADFIYEPGKERELYRQLGIVSSE